ncbi:MAG: hypothetical protein AAF492_16255, partial [Verrucomicrobiota bacterium]
MASPASRSRKLIFVLVMILLVLVAVEIITFAVFKIFEDRFSFFEPEKYLVKEKYYEKFSNRFDAVLGWDYRLDTPFNERERETNYNRIVAATFGDSYTYCDDVDHDESWQHYASEELEA